MSAEPVVPGEGRRPDTELVAELFENATSHRDPAGTPYSGWPGLLREAAERIIELQRARPALPAPPDPAKFSERPFAEAVARVALLAMERTGMDLIGKYSREPVYPEAFVAAVADMWVRGRLKGGAALPAEPPQ